MLSFFRLEFFVGGLYSFHGLLGFLPVAVVGLEVLYMLAHIHHLFA